MKLFSIHFKDTFIPFNGLLLQYFYGLLKNLLITHSYGYFWQIIFRIKKLKIVL